jgi:hypothetical protein
MQRLRNDERGAIAIFVAILMIMLLGFAALAIDISAMWAEKRQLQNGADAGALAIAQTCAKTSASCSEGMADTTAQSYVGLNRTVGTPTGTADLAGNSVTVTASDQHENWFAQVIEAGDSEGVSAKATAKWGGPSKGASFPLAFSVCEWNWQAGGPDSTTEHLIVTSKTSTSTTCTGPSGLEVPGGFGWIDSAISSCGMESEIDNWIPSEPGNNPSKGCTQEYFQSLLGKTLLIPVFGEDRGTGAGAEYKIYGYAAFKFTGYFFGGHYKSSSPAPCNGDDRCIKGYFTRYVNLDEVLEVDGSAPDLGLTIVTLTE